MTGATDQQPLSVVLVGPPGAGKSTIGRKLARELGVDLYDTDAGIEEQTGRTIPEIFAQDGEPEFRRIEEEVVRAAVLAEHGIISLGGGSVLSAATRELLRGRTVVYLEISVGEGLRRTGASTNRPLLNTDDPAAKYRALMKVRRPLYREVASVRVRTDGRSPGRVVRMILGKLGLESTLPPEEATPENPTPALEPNVSSRSRSRRRRRRGRGRGEAQPTATESSSTTAEEVSASPSTPTGEPAAQHTGPTRTRRSRGRGRKAKQLTEQATSTTGEAAPATLTTAIPHTATIAPAAMLQTSTTPDDVSETGGAATAGRGRRSRRRGRRPAGPATPTSSADIAKPTGAQGETNAAGSAAAHGASATPEGLGRESDASATGTDATGTGGLAASGPHTGALATAARRAGSAPTSAHDSSISAAGSERTRTGVTGSANVGNDATTAPAPDSETGTRPAASTRASEAAEGPGSDAAQSDSTVAATPGAGRSRRARARRARARARTTGEHIPDTPAREESEQHP